MVRFEKVHSNVIISINTTISCNGWLRINSKSLSVSTGIFHLLVNILAQSNTIKTWFYRKGKTVLGILRQQ